MRRAMTRNGPEGERGQAGEYKKTIKKKGRGVTLSHVCKYSGAT